MSEQESMLGIHYQKLQESLGELLEPSLSGASRSLVTITLNQTFTRAEKLFELAENTVSLSSPKQALLAKLAHHIENCKEAGMRPEFVNYIRKELMPALITLKSKHEKNFPLAS